MMRTCGLSATSLHRHKEEPKVPDSASSDEENEDGDFTVYECPGLAPVRWARDGWGTCELCRVHWGDPVPVGWAQSDAQDVWLITKSLLNLSFISP